VSAYVETRYVVSSNSGEIVQVGVNEGDILTFFSEDGSEMFSTEADLIEGLIQALTRLLLEQKKGKTK